MSMPAPPSYGTATLQHAASVPGLDFVDFIPKVLEDGFFKTTKYEPFTVLLEQANGYLRDNPHVEVKTCESVEFYVIYNEPELQKMMHKEIENLDVYNVRALRLWLVKRADSSLPPQQIGYFNFVPNVVEEGIGNPKFEYLDSTLERINVMLKNQPLAGRILNMETQEMKYYSFNPDKFEPDKTYWQEADDKGILRVNVLRIFYEHGPPGTELLGCLDFVPELLEEGGLIKEPVYSSFSTILERASHWCSQMQSGRFCSAQTLKCKIKAEGLNSKRMHNYEHAKRRTKFVKFLRVTYVQPFVPNNVVPPRLVLTAKTFAPVQLNKSKYFPKVEKYDQTKPRMQAWVAAISGRVLSAETVRIKLQYHYDSDTVNKTFSEVIEKNPRYVTVLRVYFDGAYNEPPAEVLPPLPEPVDDCCNLL